MDFLNINTCFNNESQRNIAYLSSLYMNKSYLYNEIKSIIEPHLNKKEIQGKKVLLKPNWVKHNSKETDSICLCTNENFIIATLEYVLIQDPKSIVIGDAPIQGCNWEKLLSDDFYKEINRLKDKFSIEIEIKDFRRTHFELQKNKITNERVSIDNYTIFNLGKDSFLESISKTQKSNFRVTDYDPDRLAESHYSGTHKYCITNDLFNADIVITIPKIKTHQKSGFTNSLKILVGINGDKDFLPHHRKGGDKNGGDCYPGYNLIRKCAETVLDYSNKHIGKRRFKILRKLVSLLWILSKPTKEHTLGAAWHGNDTVWRMVLDLNKIAMYGKIDGTLADTTQRKIYTLCDGIIAGQSDGPLNPDPLELGIIAFSNNSYCTDICISQLLQIEVSKVKLLNEANKLYNHNDIELKMDGSIISEKDLLKYSIAAQMPPGWINYNVK